MIRLHCQRSWIIVFHLLCLSLFAGTPLARADHIPFQVGDVFINTGLDTIEHRNGAGNLLETLDLPASSFSRIGGLAFDAAGNLYVTRNDRRIDKFNNQGAFIGTFGSGQFASAASLDNIVFDSSGNAYVATRNLANNIRKLDPDGTVIATFSVEPETNMGPRWMELAADQCTLFYTTGGPNVKRFDVCSNEQLADFNAEPLPWNTTAGLRLLPNGQLIVSQEIWLVRLDSSGKLVPTADDPLIYDVVGQHYWLPVALDPDGTSFWSTGYASKTVFKFDIETGQQLLVYDIVGFTATPITVFGEQALIKEFVPAPRNLRVKVADQRIDVSWSLPHDCLAIDFSSISVSYEVKVERFDEVTQTFVDDVGTFST
jgi:DNA-binding beta-propeller fold protein YncE